MNTFKTDRQTLINLLKALTGKNITLIQTDNKLLLQDHQQTLPVLRIE